MDGERSRLVLVGPSDECCVDTRAPQWRTRYRNDTNGVARYAHTHTHTDGETRTKWMTTGATKRNATTPTGTKDYERMKSGPGTSSVTAAAAAEVTYTITFGGRGVVGITVGWTAGRGVTSSTFAGCPLPHQTRRRNRRHRSDDVVSPYRRAYSTLLGRQSAVRLERVPTYPRACYRPSNPLPSIQRTSCPGTGARSAGTTERGARVRARTFFYAS